MHWRRLADGAHNSFTEEPVRACYLTKVFHFYYGRGTPYGSQALFYPGLDSFAPDLKTARLRVEQRRTNGSRWFIDELPAVVLAGSAHAVVVCEINTEEPLAEFLRVRKRLRTLEDAGGYFEPRSRHQAVMTIATGARIMPVADLPFRVHQPDSYRGKRFDLVWRTSISDADPVPALRLVTRITRALQEDARRNT